MPELNQSADEKEQAKLFSEMYKAVQTNDFEAQDRLVNVKEDTENEVKVETQEVEEPVSSDSSVVVEDEKVEGTEAVEDATSTVTAETETNTDPREAELVRLKAELDARKQEVHRLRSDAGRVPSLQRKLSEMEKRLREVGTTSTAASKRTDVRASQSQKLAQIKETDPLIAEAIEEALAERDALLRQELEAKEAEQRRSKDEVDEEELFNQEWNKLSQAVPNASEIFQHPEWKEWKKTLPENQLRLATSIYADDVLIAIEHWAKAMAVKYPEFYKATNTEVVQTTATSTVSDDKATKTAAAREKRLTTQTPSSDGSKAAKVQHELNEEELFSKIFKEEQAKYKR